MKQKLLKMLLIPSLGLMTTTAAITTATSCDSDSDHKVNYETKCFWITPYGKESITFKLWQQVAAQDRPNLEFAVVGKNGLGTIDNLQDAKWKSVDMDVQYTIKTNQIMALKGNNPNGWLRFTGDAATPAYTQTGNISISGDTTIGGSLMGLLDNGGKNQIDNVPERCFSSLFRASEDDVTSTASEICEIKNNLFWSINNENCNLGAHCFQNMFGYNDKLTEVCLDDIFPTKAIDHFYTYGYEFQHSNIQKFYMNVYCNTWESSYSYIFYGCSTINDVTLNFVDEFDTSVAFDSLNMYYTAYRDAFNSWMINLGGTDKGTVKFITHLANPGIVTKAALKETFNLNSNWTIEIA